MTKQNVLKLTARKLKVVALVLVMLSIQACTKSGQNLAGSANSASSSSTGVTPVGSTPAPTPTGTGTAPVVASAAIVAGQGSSISGGGAVTCPTAQGIVAAVQNVLGVSITKGNTALAYTQLVANLPSSTDCTQSVGYDNAQLFIYAACSDLVTKTAPIATSTYKVTLTSSVASQQAALVAAGITILNGFTGGIAGASNASAGINTALTNLLTSATPPSTSTIAFMDVCMAATSAGALLISN